jgi:hypothetical protein
MGDVSKELTVEQASREAALLELGKVLGQSNAFGTISGRCSAAQAGALRQARNEKVHEHFKLTWKEFCPIHVKMSGTMADTLIRLLEEFGPDYFEHTQAVRISADTYRLVAPLIQDKALHVDGEVLELNSANVQTVAKSVRAKRGLLPPAAAPDLAALMDALDRSAVHLVSQFREVAQAVRDSKSGPLCDSKLYQSVVLLHADLDGLLLEMSS